MKKIHMIAALLAMLLPITQAWGTTYYYKLHLAVSSASTGSGKVYAATSNSDSGATYGSTSDATPSRYDNQSVNTGYAFAKADYGSVFKGWATDNGTLTTTSSNNPYNPTVKATGTSADKAAPTQNYYAVFGPNPDSYTLTLNNPAGLSSYTVTAPSGFTADLSHGGSATVYKGDQYSFKYTLSSDEYDFINWTVNGEQKTSNPVSVTISGNTTVVLTLKKKVTYTATCQGSVGGTYKANGTTVSGSDYEVSNFGSVTVSLSNPVPNAGYAFYGWYKLYSNGVKEYLSYYTSVSTGEMKENIVIGAEFREVQDCTVNFIAPAEGKITYAISGGNSGEVDDADKSETVPAGADVTLTATCDYANRRAKWYTKDDSGEKVYFSIDNNLTRKFASSVALGVDFIPVNEKIVNAIEAAQSSSSHEAILAADAEIVLDTSIEIPSGIKIDLDGHTLYVDGTLTVNGTLVNGTVSKCLKVVKQTGADGMVPINPYGSVKYWKTDKAVASTASVTGWDGTLGTHLTVMRGDGVAVRGAITSSTQLVKCTFDGSIAVNHVTAIGAASDTADISENLSYILLANVTINGPVVLESSKYNRIRNSATIDCAGWACTMGNKQISSSNSSKILNAPTFTYNSEYWQNGAATFYNCPSISIKPVKNTPPFYLYDSGSTKLEFTQNSGGTAECFFYSGKFDTDLSGNGPSWINVDSKIYGGGFKLKPDTKWIEETKKSTHTFSQHSDGYWYLDINQDPNVASISGTKYLTIEEALDYLEDNAAATITLLRNVRMESAYTLEAGKSLVIELNGCHIDAPNGFVKNYGSLSIRDNNNSLAVCGVTVGSGSNIIENYDNGTSDICYGLYNGNFAVNGGTFTTHHGKFIGSVANNGGTVNLKGGVFSSDVSSLMNEGYHAFAYGGWYYVGRFPKPEDDSSSIASFARVLTAMPSADKTLYLAKKTYSLTSCSSVDEWKRVAELKAAYVLYDDEFNFDILVGFDQDIAANTVQATVDSKFGPQSDYFPAMNAGVLERIFSPRITQNPISYKRFIYDNGEGNYDTMEAGVSAVNNANAGTLCVLAMDLWKFHDKTKTTKDSYLTILALPYVFGAGNDVAMIRSATVEATFKSTLQGAIDVVKNNGGGTVMLANNCNEIPNFDMVGTYIVDSMGFEHGFSDAEGGYTVAEGLSVKTEIVPSSVATLTIDDRAVLPGAVAIKYVVVAGSAATAVDAPTAVSGLVYDGTEKTGVAAGTGYTLSGNTATAAGSYTATATLEEGYVWSDDSSEAKEISWSIGKASLTATAENKSVIRGETVPYTITYSGFVNGEDVSALTAAPTASCDYNAADMSATATSYPITLSGGSAANYNITLVPGTLTVNPCVATIEVNGETSHYKSLGEAIEDSQEDEIVITVTSATTETVSLEAGKTLEVTVADGVNADVTVNPGNGAFIETETSGTTTTYTAKQITVEMAEPSSVAAVEMEKIENGSTNAVSDTSLVSAVVAALMDNVDVPRTDNTDKLDVVDVITVTPTKIVQEVIGAAAAIIRAATFDVVPTFKAGQSLGEGQKLKFRLPVDAAATQLAAIVYHNGAQFGIYPVQTYNAEKFVEVESDTFSPYGYELLDGETANPVAAIGTTGYASLSAAVAAAQSGDTITMLADDHVSLTNGQEIEINKPLTITGLVDGNGDPLYTIYGTPTNTGYNDVFVASSSGTVTISNLAFAEFGNEAANSVNGHAPIFVSSGNNNVVLENLVISDFNRTAIKINGGEFLVKDCYIDCDTDVTNYRVGGIDIANDATGSIVGTSIVNVDTSNPTDWVAAALEIIGSGDILVEDCSITSSMYGIFVSTAAGTSPGSSAVTVVDTTVNADVYSLINDSDSADAEIAVESGSYTGMLYAETETGLAISGGEFDDEVPEEYCADGFIPAEQDPDTGLYTVKVGTYVAQIVRNDEVVGKYETLAEAVAAAQSDDTVQLLTDVTGPFVLGKNATITLDLNGKTISVNCGDAISVTAGELTVTSAVDDDGNAIGGIDGTLSVSEGAALNIQGGIYAMDWDDCDIDGTITVSSVNSFYDWDPTEVEAASAVFTSPVPYEYCADGYIPGEYDDIYIDGDFYYYVKEGEYLWRITDADGKVAYSEDVPDAEDDEEDWEYDWFGQHEMNRNGFTMTLLRDVSADEDFSVWVSGLTYTIDLGGHTVNQQMGFGVGKCYVTITNGVVSNASGTAISIANGAQVTLGDGLVISQSTTGVHVDGGTEAGEYSKLTVTDGAVINGTYGVLVFGSGSENPVTELIVEGGEITGTQYYGISGNGTIEGDVDYSNTRISISGGTVTGGIAGIYHPQAGTLSVSGGEISGGMAIYAKSGTISVTGGELSANGARGQYDESYAGSGPQQTGDALALDSVNYPGGNPTASISGGTFRSTNGEGVASYAATGQTAASGFVSGGTFSGIVPDDYCVDGYSSTTAPDANGMYIVISDNDAQIVRNNVVVARGTLADMIDAAQSGDTIQLLKSVIGVTDSFEFRSKNITIDGDGYSIVAAENTTPRSVIDSWSGARNMFVVQSGNVTFKDITLDGGETHYYTFLVQAKNGTTTFDNVELLHGGEADSSGTEGVGYGAAVQVDGADVVVNGSFYADTHGAALEEGQTGNQAAGIFPFTALLYQSGSIHFNNNVDVDIGQDLLLVGMMGAVDVSTTEGKAQVQEMLDAMNVPAGFAPYTLSLGSGDNSLASFTGASPLGWNDIIDYGKDIMDVSSSLGMEMDKNTTPVEVGLLTDTVLPEPFTYEDPNFTVNGNGNALSGEIKFTDDAGTLENVVMGTVDDPLVLDMTGLSEGKSMDLGSGISASNVTIKVTEEQVATMGTTIVTWNTEGQGEGEGEAEPFESGITVTVVDKTTGEPVTEIDEITGEEKPKEASLVWDDEYGRAYVGPCQARLTGPGKEPVYTSLAHAIELAAQSGDTVTLLMDIGNFTGTQNIYKSLTLDGAGHTIAAAPVATHRDVVNAWAGSTSMFKLQTGDITFRNITLDGDATHAYTFLISADNSNVSLTTENIKLLNGGELCGDENGNVLEEGAGYGAAIHLNNGASLTVKDGFYACTGGETSGVFPFTGILPENLDAGTSVTFDLTEDSDANPTVGIGNDLLLVGMVGAIPLDDAQAILDYMKVPKRFIPYTLTLGDGTAYAFTGASPLGWNQIIDYGKEIMEVSTALGYENLETNSTPVEVGLLTDTILPDTFRFADTNFTVNGNGNALSGEIEYTDNAGLIKDIVMGTEDDPLVLNMTNVTQAIEFGAGVAVTNVTIKLTESQATAGTPIIIWDAEGGVDAPANEEGVKVTVVDEVSGQPTGEEAELIWDDEMGMAYIGPCDARLTGPTHVDPIYTTLSNAVEQAAASGDTVTLMTNVTLTAEQTIDKSIVFNLNGKALVADGDALSIDSNAAVQMFSDGVVTGNVFVASGTLTITNGVYIGTIGKTSGDVAQIVISGGFFSNKVPAEYCAEGYFPTEQNSDGLYTVTQGYAKGDKPVIAGAATNELTTSEATFLNSLLINGKDKETVVDVALAEASSVGAFRDAAMLNIDITQDYADPVFRISAIKRSRAAGTVTVTVSLDRHGKEVSEKIYGTLVLRTSSDAHAWSSCTGAVADDASDDDLANFSENGETVSFTMPISGNGHIFKATISPVED